jgi:predicted branched-subunit amino acid permease
LPLEASQEVEYAGRADLRGLPLARHQDDSYLIGARAIAPLALGVAIYGMAFGLLATQAGLSPFEVTEMGGVVFAGSSQIVFTQQWLAGSGALAALAAAVVLNFRILLITASITDVFVGRPFWQVAIAAHLAADENWAMLLARRSAGGVAGYRFFVGAGMVQFVVWLAATTLGAVLANAIPDPKRLGMDFAFTAAFIAIAITLFRGRADVAPWAATIGLVLFSVTTGWLAAPWALVFGGIAGAAVSAVFGRD